MLHTNKRRKFEMLVENANRCNLCTRMCGRKKVLSERNGNIDSNTFIHLYSSVCKIIPDRCKYSININMNHPKGRELIKRLVAQADVVVENFTPGTMDKWGIDVVVCGSQKALMLPPGLSFVALNDKAWTFVERSNMPKFYFDFKKELKSAKKNQSSYTPGISLFVGLRESLKMIREEGLEAVFRRHQRLAEATRAAVKALGLELYAPDSPSNAVTAVKIPSGIDGEKLKDLFFEKFGITVAEGQDRAKGKIVRIAHLGYYEKLDMVMVISALEMLLREMGYAFELGTGVRAAEVVLME